MSVKNGFWFYGSGILTIAVYATSEGLFVEFEEDMRKSYKRRVTSPDADSILEAAAILAANSNYPSSAMDYYRILEDDIQNNRLWIKF